MLYAGAMFSHWIVQQKNLSCFGQCTTRAYHRIIIIWAWNVSLLIRKFILRMHIIFSHCHLEWNNCPKYPTHWNHSSIPRNVRCSMKFACWKFCPSVYTIGQFSNCWVHAASDLRNLMWIANLTLKTSCSINYLFRKFLWMFVWTPRSLSPFLPVSEHILWSPWVNLKASWWTKVTKSKTEETHEVN